MMRGFLTVSFLACVLTVASAANMYFEDLASLELKKLNPHVALESRISFVRKRPDKLLTLPVKQKKAIRNSKPYTNKLTEGHKYKKQIKGLLEVNAHLNEESIHTSTKFMTSTVSSARKQEVAEEILQEKHMPKQKPMKNSNIKKYLTTQIPLTEEHVIEIITPSLNMQNVNVSENVELNQGINTKPLSTTGEIKRPKEEVALKNTSKFSPIDNITYDEYFDKMNKNSTQERFNTKKHQFIIDQNLKDSQNTSRPLMSMAFSRFNHGGTKYSSFLISTMKPNFFTPSKIDTKNNYDPINHKNKTTLVNFTENTNKTLNMSVFSEEFQNKNYSKNDTINDVSINIIGLYIKPKPTNTMLNNVSNHENITTPIEIINDVQNISMNYNDTDINVPIIVTDSKIQDNISEVILNTPVSTPLEEYLDELLNVSETLNYDTIEELNTSDNSLEVEESTIDSLVNTDILQNLVTDEINPEAVSNETGEEPLPMEVQHIPGIFIDETPEWRPVEKKILNENSPDQTEILPKSLVVKSETIGELEPLPKSESMPDSETPLAKSEQKVESNYSTISIPLTRSDIIAIDSINTNEEIYLSEPIIEIAPITNRESIPLGVSMVEKKTLLENKSENRIKSALSDPLPYSEPFSEPENPTK